LGLETWASRVDALSPKGWSREVDNSGNRIYKSVSGDHRLAFSADVRITQRSAQPWHLDRTVSVPSRIGKDLTELRDTDRSSLDEVSGEIMSITASLSRAFSRDLKAARFVVYWNVLSRKFVPGLYCPDVATALFALTVWSSGVAGGWGVCPKCDKGFVRNRSDQVYCKDSCQSAAGMKRMRDRKKAKRKSKGS
jgi:hypothetical protein